MIISLSIFFIFGLGYAVLLHVNPKMNIELTLSDDGRNKFFYTLVHVLGHTLNACRARPFEDSHMQVVDKHQFTGGSLKKSTPEYVSIPAEGRFSMTFKSNVLFFDIVVDNTVSDSVVLHQRPMQDVITRKKRVTAYWQPNSSFGESDVVQLINEVQGRHGNAKIWTHSMYDWVQRGEVSGTIDNLFFSDELGQKLVKSIEKFMSKQERFKKFDRIFKRTYLLQGPPGGGKSSLIRAVAKHFNRDLYVLNMADPSVAEMIVDLVQKVPPNSVLAIEDLDRYFRNGEPVDTRFTTSMILNAFDGVLSASNGLVTFMTANHPENLPPALVRQGRVDEVVRVDGTVTPEQFQTAFCAVVDEEGVEPESALYEIVRVQKMSMADVMEILFTGDTPEERLQIARSITRSRRFEPDSSMFM
jgi:hypothetical protein